MTYLFRGRGWRARADREILYPRWRRRNVGMARKQAPWSLLSTHGLVLVCVSRYGDITVMDIAKRTGVSRGTVLRVLRDLQASGMLDVCRLGRKNTYRIRGSVTFRHPVLRGRGVEELLKAFPEAAD